MSAFDAVMRWLWVEGQHQDDLPALLDGLLRRLVAAGVAVDRAAFGIELLHPHYRFHTMMWTATAGVTDVQPLPFSMQSAPAYTDSPINAVTRSGVALRRRLVGADARLDFPVLAELAAEGYAAYGVLPIKSRRAAVAIITLASREPTAFDDPLWQQIDEVFQAAAPVIGLMRAERVARDLMGTYLGRATAARVLDGHVRPGDAEPIEAVLWLSDLRDFSALTRKLGTEAMVPLVNAYFDVMAAPVVEHGGEILKFMGDAMLAFFPIGDGGLDAAARSAVAAARAALAGLAALSAAREAEGHPPLRTGVALHAGRVLYGNIGAAQRLDFTVFGDAVNRLARIETLCAPLDAALLMSAEVAARCGAPVMSRGRHRLKGEGEAIEVFALADP